MNVDQKPREGEQYVLYFYWLLSHATWLEEWTVSNIRTCLPKLFKKVRQNNKNIFHKMYFDDGGMRQKGEKREREKKGGLTVGERGEVEDEAESRESSYDGRDQGTTCQTLEVISCFVEDFYGILAAWPTSQREGGDGEKDPTHLPPPFHSFPPFFCFVQSVYPQLSLERVSRANTTRIPPAVGE